MCEDLSSLDHSQPWRDQSSFRVPSSGADPQAVRVYADAELSGRISTRPSTAESLRHLTNDQSETFIMTNHRVPHLPPAASDWLMSDGILLVLNCKNYVMTTLMMLTAFCLSSAVPCSALLEVSGDVRILSRDRGGAPQAGVFCNKRAL